MHSFCCSGEGKTGGSPPLPAAGTINAFNSQFNQLIFPVLLLTDLLPVLTSFLSPASSPSASARSLAFLFEQAGYRHLLFQPPSLASLHHCMSVP